LGVFFGGYRNVLPCDLDTFGHGFIAFTSLLGKGL